MVNPRSRTRGQIHAGLGALVSLTGGTVIGMVTAFLQTPAGNIAPMLGAAFALVGIYGFLLLAYRDLLRGQAKLEGEPDVRKDALAQVREDVARQISEIARRIDGLEERERGRLEEKAKE